MAIAKKSVIWVLFAAGGTLTAFIYPALIFLFLLIATGNVPDGIQYEQFYTFIENPLGKAIMFGVLFLSLWHAAHRFRVVAHDFGIRKDKLVAYIVYSVAMMGSVLTIYFLLQA